MKNMNEVRSIEYQFELYTAYHVYGWTKTAVFKFKLQFLIFVPDEYFSLLRRLLWRQCRCSDVFTFTITFA